MRPNLIFITGAPGVGKTAVATSLFQRLSGSVWLDGDDVWRMNPWRVDDTTTSMVEGNIQFILRNFLVSGFSHVILSWVLHRQDIIDRILTGLDGLEYDLFVFTLVCDEETLVSRRSKSDPSRGRTAKLALTRLRQSKDLDTTKLDTTHRQPDEIAEQIIQMIGSEKTLG